MSKATKLSVGQKLWWVPGDKRTGAPRWVEVQSVGRKWAKIGWHGRVDVETLVVDTNVGLAARCYLSQEEWEAKVQLNRAWSEFCRWVGDQHRTPDGMTLDRIEAAMNILIPSPPPTRREA